LLAQSDPDKIRYVTWEELAAIHRAAANHLFGMHNPLYERAVCSRAYYAVYALITSRLPSSVAFGRGWQNPQHVKLPKYVANIAALHENERRAIRRALRRLRQRREDADYRPGITVDRLTANESIRDVSEVFEILVRR
jgi:uncharacterized protein (UPF0332 family)